jgi:hypothetical protein
MFPSFDPQVAVTFRSPGPGVCIDSVCAIPLECIPETGYKSLAYRGAETSKTKSPTDAVKIGLDKIIFPLLSASKQRRLKTRQVKRSKVKLKHPSKIKVPRTLSTYHLNNQEIPSTKHLRGNMTCCGTVA